MITKLTKKQEKLLEETRNEWLDRIFKRKVKKEDNRCVELIKWMYKISDLKEPLVIFLNSPLALQFGANISQVRSQVWSQVRSQVESQVGFQVRSQVESQVESQVGSQVWSQVGSQVRSQVWSQVGSQVWSQVRSQVESQVGFQVRSQVWSQVRSQVRSQVESQVGSQVGFQVWSQVGSQVWSQVESQVRSQKLKLYDFSYYGEISDYGWVAFYDFFEKLGIINENFKLFKELMTYDIYQMIQSDGLCLVSRHPKYIKRDAQNNLHSEDGYAIEFNDGYGQHYLNGVFFDEELYWKIIKKEIKAIDVLKIKNIEQRYCALKFLGAETLLKELNAKLINKSKKGNELYSLSGILEQPLKLLKYSCPSTKREYVSFVPFEQIKADEAMSWKFQISLNDYYNIKFES